MLIPIRWVHVMAALVCSIAWAQPARLKVYISVDMEGVAGAITQEQLRPGGFEYARFREFMTQEALAAVRAAKEAGATGVLVADSHGNGQNLLVDLFPKDVRVIRGFPRKLGMMAGIDATFDAVVFIGYHASTSNPAGVRAHTFSSASLTRVGLNGAAVTEGAFNAAIAGHFGVPVVMVAGDDAVIAEVRSAIGPVAGVETKKSMGFHSADTLTPEAARELIYEGVKAALTRRKDFKPYVVRAPVTLDISFKNYVPVEILSYLRSVERTDSHSIRFLARDILEAADFAQFVTSYNVQLEP